MNQKESPLNNQDRFLIPKETEEASKNVPSMTMIPTPPYDKSSANDHNLYDCQQHNHGTIMAHTRNREGFSHHSRTQGEGYRTNINSMMFRTSGFVNNSNNGQNSIGGASMYARSLYSGNSFQDDYDGLQGNFGLDFRENMASMTMIPTPGYDKSSAIDKNLYDWQQQNHGTIMANTRNREGFSHHSSMQSEGYRTDMNSMNFPTPGFVNNSNNGQNNIGGSSMYATSLDSGSSFQDGYDGLQGNFGLDSRENMASMITTPGYVNSRANHQNIFDCQQHNHGTVMSFTHNIEDFSHQSRMQCMLSLCLPYGNISVDHEDNIASTSSLIIKNNHSQMQHIGGEYSPILHNHSVTSVGTMSSTSSSLSHPNQFQQQSNQFQQQPQWTDRKKLSNSDVSLVQCQLVLHKNFVEKHIQPHIPQATTFEQRVSSGSGIIVNVYDYDTRSTHQLCLAFKKSYVPRGNWSNGFIKRRELKEGDMIGLLWDRSKSRLQCSVLCRATPKPPA